MSIYEFPKKVKDCGSCTICQKKSFKNSFEYSPKSCVWLDVNSFSEAWKPSNSNILLSWVSQGIPKSNPNKLGIKIEILSKLKRADLKNLMALLQEGLKKGTPYFLVISSVNSNENSTIYLNDKLSPLLGSFKFGAEFINILAGDEMPKEEKMAENIVSFNNFKANLNPAY